MISQTRMICSRENFQISMVNIRVRDLRRTQNAPEIGIVVNVTRVQVISDRPFKQGRILGDDRQPAPEIKQSHGRSVDAIDGDMTAGRLDYSEQRERQGRFASPGSTYYTDFLVRLNVQIDVL